MGAKGGGNCGGKIACVYVREGGRPKMERERRGEREGERGKDVGPSHYGWLWNMRPP